jgi:nucleotide-binding universal stress UspA family protein
MEERAAALRADGLVVDAVVRTGAAPDVIISEVGVGGADLIAMSTHGRGGLGRALYGSVADDVLRRTAVPILLVPAPAAPRPPDGGLRPVLVALDGSELAEASLGPAADLARAGGAGLVLLRVVDPSAGLGRHASVASARSEARRYLDALRRRLRRPRGDVTSRVRVGPVAPTILAAAAELGAGAIALGTHGRSGLGRLVMGSVATGLIEHGSLPLLLVSSAAAQRAALAGGRRLPKRASAPV